MIKASGVDVESGIIDGYEVSFYFLMEDCVPHVLSCMASIIESDVI